MSCHPVVTDISGLQIITIFKFKHQEDCLTCSSKTSVIVCLLTWQNNTKDFNVHQQWRENLISCMRMMQVKAQAEKRLYQELCQH
jgi:hypothetical protein